MFDRLLRRAALPGRAGLHDLGLKDGRIAAIAPSIAADMPDASPVEDLGGRLLSPGLVDSHVHLDKACLLDRCPVCAGGDLSDAIFAVADAKGAFDEEDVRARAERVLTMAVLHGTMRMRSFVETDPRAELRSLHALLDLRRDWAPRIDLQLCAFAQEGLTQEMETLSFLAAALEAGADMVGGCPYADPNPEAHVRLIFDLAAVEGCRVDFHVDFDLSPEGSALPAILRETEARGMEGMVSIGHVTKLSAVSPARFRETAMRLASAGVAITALPATDLWLLGRDAERLVPRGVAPLHRMARVKASLATNNVLNPFTPFGDASLIRMANLYANVCHAGTDEELARVFAMITGDAAAAMGFDARIEPGAPADLVLFDAPSDIAAIREAAPALRGWKGGRPSFERPAPRLI